MTYSSFRTALAAVAVVCLGAPLNAQYQGRGPVRNVQQGGGGQQDGTGQRAPLRNDASRGSQYRAGNTNTSGQGFQARGDQRGQGGVPNAQRTPAIPRAGIPQRRQPLPRHAAQPLKPDWAGTLGPKHAKHLNDILKYWEFSSSKIETYRCKFQRWEYDTVFGPQNDCKTYGVGEIKYAQPDKGLFRVDTIKTYTLGEKPGEKPRHVERPDVKGEHWVCDGRYVFDHDHTNKQLMKRELPKEMRGKAITNGPLPFMFGAKAQEILDRYWIRVITPASVRKAPANKQQYWLEAYPKRAEDAANYLKVHIIIDYTTFLPQGMVIFDRGYRPPMNETRTVFQFEQRKINFNKNILQVFMRDFYNVRPPGGWKLVLVPAEEPQTNGPRTARSRQGGKR